MKRRRINPNIWVLAFLGLIIVLTGIDIGRRMMLSAQTEAKAEEVTRAKADPKTYVPPFKVGDGAPDFELPDKDGKPHKLSDLVKRDTLLSFLCGCAHCRGMQAYLATVLGKMGPNAPDTIGVTTQTVEFEEAYREQTGLKDQVLLYEGSGSKVMDSWKGHPCPRIFRLSADRKVTFIGDSPATAPNIATLADQAADELGFRTSFSKDRSRPPAPPVPPALQTLSKQGPSGAPMMPTMPPNGPPNPLGGPGSPAGGPPGLGGPGSPGGGPPGMGTPPGAPAIPQGHSADDGHNHGPGDGHGH